MENDARTLIARLLVHRYVSRSDAQVRRLLTDDAFYRSVSDCLLACGLELAEHPYAEYVSTRIRREEEQSVFGEGESWLSNNLGLARDHIALLVVLWALLILPKRQRQLERQLDGGDLAQGQMFGEGRPIPQATDLKLDVAEATLQADFAQRLGGKTRINFGLGALARLGFIERRGGHICEGPLLDLAVDYNRVAPRILNGALADLLGRRGSEGAGKL